MDTRGAGLAAAAVALVGVLAACGGAASASVASPNATAPVDVESIVRDEIAELAALGYPADDTSVVIWEFSEGYQNENGGNAAANYPNAGDPTLITLNPSVEQYARTGDADLRVRSTVRHEFGHALVYSLGYGSSVEDEIALRSLCPDPAERAPVNTRWGHECIAEAISETLSTERQMPRFEFYGGTDLSPYSLGSAREFLDRVSTSE